MGNQGEYIERTKENDIMCNVIAPQIKHHTTHISNFFIRMVPVPWTICQNIFVLDAMDLLCILS